VNLIGEHTDYNGGLALPFALDRRTSVAVGPRDDRIWRCWSTRAPATANGQAPQVCDLRELDGDHPSGWSRYVVGVAWAFLRRGVDVPGADIFIDSDVPVGSGLSSSAALTTAVAVALRDLTGAELSPEMLVELCHEAEADFVGAPTGTLDQRAALLSRPGHGLLIDFSTDETTPIPLDNAGPFVVVDTGVRHDHATGGYGERRRECEEAAAQLGLAYLSQASLDTVEDRLDGRLRSRARHVVTENARVVEAARRLARGEGIGDLLLASHASLRDDFEVSCPELDIVVDAVVESGAAGARMIGGGFGGSVIVAGLEPDLVHQAAVRGLARLGRTPATVFEAIPSAPAGRAC
jgi:galactokinase